jgi:hypothetical protein
MRGAGSRPLAGDTRRPEGHWNGPPEGVRAPYGRAWCSLVPHYVSTARHVTSGGKRGGPPPKAKYRQRPIVNQYREGTVKSTPVRGVK